VLRDVMRQPIPRLAVLPIDWQLLVAELPTGTPPVLADVAAGRPGGRHAPARPGRRTVQTELAAVAPEDRYRVLQAFVAREVALVLALDPRQVLEPARGLSDVGMDSLMAVELANRLSAGVGRKLPSTLAFECPTLGELTAHLAELLGVHDPADDAPTSAAADALAELSDDAVTEMLLQELEDTGY
jgi:acyl carrier protein